MQVDIILEEYLLCLFVETVRYVLSRMGKINPATEEKYDVTTLLKIAFLQENDPVDGEKDPMRSPLVRSLFCLAILMATESMRERRKTRQGRIRR